MGYLSDAICNYLLRLGWSHGDDEIISREQAIQWFGLNNVGKSPSRFDFDKLANLNAHYLKHTDNDTLTTMLLEKLDCELDDTLVDRLTRGMDSMKDRVKTINDLVEYCQFYINDVQYPLTGKSAKMMNETSQALCGEIAEHLDGVSNWNADEIGSSLKAFAEQKELGFGKIGQPTRAAVSGTPQSPDLAQMLEVFGKNEVIKRLRAVPATPTE